MGLFELNNKTISVIKMIGNLEVQFTSELEDGKKCDTSVSVNKIFLCNISGWDIEDFGKDLKEVIRRYEI